MSPTNTSVVLETLIKSQKIAHECSQQYIQVTYDLAIYKIANQILSTEKPQFDNVFINLEQFHIEMAFFKVVGKVFDNCGVTNIMIDSDLLATGSVNGFISGKHFNLCKRLHPIAAIGLQILHFEAFLKDEKIEILEDVLIKLENI